MRSLLLLVLAGCAGQAPVLEPATAPSAATAERTGTLAPSTPPPPEPRPVDPEGARWHALATRLRAHDTADLPDRAALEAIPDVVEGLTWLAEHDPSLNVRARALDALGLVGTVEAVDRLRLVLADRALHPKLRAAAAIGLGRLPGDASAQGALLSAVADADLRVATEAVDQLARQPSTWPLLRQVAAEPAVLPEVRARIDALR